MVWNHLISLLVLVMGFLKINSSKKEHPENKFSDAPF